MKYNHKQSGFIMMILLVIMVLGAAVYFANFTENRFFQHQSKEHLQKMTALEKVKNNLLLYVILHPEIYATNGSGTSYHNASMVPGPGYFPCPDNNGRSTADVPNGIMQSSCSDASTNDGFVHGFLPPIIKGRNIVFTPNRQEKQYYFVVLENLVYQNPNFINNNRYTPLNSTFTPAPANLLSLNGRADYVALLFLPGKPQTFGSFVQDQTQHSVQNFLDYKLDASGNRIDGNVLLNNTLNREFFSKSSRGNLGINDLVVGITLQEWSAAIYTRVANQRNLFCDNNNLHPDNTHWFNAHTTNPVGSDWRGIICP